MNVRPYPLAGDPFCHHPDNAGAIADALFEMLRGHISHLNYPCCRLHRGRYEYILSDGRLEELQTLRDYLGENLAMLADVIDVQEEMDR